jgi:ribosomal-protein-alanine N-acetyltransferase
LGFVLARETAGEAEILTLAVAPEARCRGVARKLVQALCAALAARGAESLFLEVACDNHAANALYRRFGFRQMGQRKDYYRHPQSGPARDALILRLDLASARLE